jgi:hypothetical protein
MSTRVFYLGVVAALGLTFAACSPQSSSPRCGVEFNPERVKRGLPVILPTWENRTSKGLSEWWVTNRFDSGKPMHTRKTIGWGAHGDAALDDETDTYVSGRAFDGSVLTNVNTDRESITIRYRHHDDRNDAIRFPSPWDCYLNSARHGGRKEISLEEAETILSSWGLKRLNYPSEPDGATNGSQPIRSETNTTPSAAGSRR